MKRHYDCVIEYLAKKSEEKYSGSVKIGFERGKIVSLVEASSFGIDTGTSGDLESCLSATIAAGSGSLVVDFEDGKTKGYAYTRTYRSDALRKVMGVE